MEFEWDDSKNAANFVRHNLAFEDVLSLFEKEIVTIRSHYHQEARWLATGELHGTIITIVYTKRGQKTRLISARYARKEEKERYYDRFSA